MQIKLQSLRSAHPLTDWTVLQVCHATATPPAHPHPQPYPSARRRDASNRVAIDWQRPQSPRLRNHSPRVVGSLCPTEMSTLRRLTGRIFKYNPQVGRRVHLTSRETILKYSSGQPSQVSTPGGTWRAEPGSTNNPCIRQFSAIDALGRGRVNRLELDVVFGAHAEEVRLGVVPEELVVPGDTASQKKRPDLALLA